MMTIADVVLLVVLYIVPAIVTGMFTFSVAREAYRDGSLTRAGLFNCSVLPITPVLNVVVSVGIMLYLLIEDDNWWTRWFSQPVRARKDN